MGILRFMDIRSNTGSGSADLIGNDRFVLTFQEFYQVQYLYRKINGKCTQFAFSHSVISFRKVIYHRKWKNQGGLPPCKHRRCAFNQKHIHPPAGGNFTGSAS